MRFFHHHCPERLYLHCSQQRQQQAGGTGVKIQRHFHVSLLPVSRSFFPFSSDFRTKSQNMIEYWTFLSVGAMNGEAGDGESQTDKLLFYFSNIIKIPSLISPSMNDGSNNITKRLWLTSNQTRAQWTHTEHPKCCLIHWHVLLDSSGSAQEPNPLVLPVSCLPGRWINFHTFLASLFVILPNKYRAVFSRHIFHYLNTAQCGDSLAGFSRHISC